MIVDMALCAEADSPSWTRWSAWRAPGPGSGDPRTIGQILASANLLALDRVACRLVGYDPDEIDYLKRPRFGLLAQPRARTPSRVGRAGPRSVRVHGFKIITRKPTRRIPEQHSRPAATP